MTGTRPASSAFLIGVLLILGCSLATSIQVKASDRQATVQKTRILLAEAKTSFAVGQADTAIARLEEVLEMDPANPDAFYFIGLIRLSHADTTGAESVLAEGVRAAPLSRRLKLLLARVWIEQGKPDEARKLVGEVMDLRPHDLDALYLQGLIALAEADTVGAISYWETALDEELGGGKR